MASAHQAFLGDVPLDNIATVEWTIGRGYEPHTVTFEQIEALRPRLAALPHVTDLRFIVDGQEIACSVRVITVAPLSLTRCTVTLADPRYDLRRAFMPQDFNVRILDDAKQSATATAGTFVQPQYLFGTSLNDQKAAAAADDPNTIQSALQGAAAAFKRTGTGSWPINADSLTASAAERADAKIADNTLTGGESPYDFYRTLLDPHGMDIVVTEPGAFRVATRNAEDLPAALTELKSWVSRPPWINGDATLKGIPPSVGVPYAKRVGLLATNEATVAPSSDRPAGRLVQVYKSLRSGGYVRLPELVTEVSTLMGARASELSEAVLANHVDAKEAGRGWEGTMLQQTAYENMTFVAGLIESDRVSIARELVSRIELDFRYLFRVQVAGSDLGSLDPDSQNYGTYTDISFGRVREVLGSTDENAGLTDAGNVDPSAAVRCAWCDIYTVAKPGAGAVVDRLEAAIKRKNNAASDDTPFDVTWESYRHGVLRIHPRESDGIERRRPGAATSERYVSNEFNVDRLGDILPAEIEHTKVSTRYNSAETIKVYLIATQRAPQDLRRWHVVERATGGDLPEKWFLQADPLAYAYFPVGATEPQNKGSVEADAERRIDRFIGAMTVRAAGSAEFFGLSAAAVEVDGPIESKTYRWRHPGVVEMVVTVGAETEDQAAARARRDRRKAELARREGAGVAKING